MINRIQDLINWSDEHTIVDGTNERRFLFRGLANDSYPLIPKISRREHDKTKGSIVELATAKYRQNLLKDYLRLNLPSYGKEYSHYPENVCQWHELFVAQHYGAPTNLLDFTRNILVATFFACRDMNRKVNGCIYAIQLQEQDWAENEEDVINSGKYNIAAFNQLKEGNEVISPYKLSKSFFISPPMIDNRIKAQIGVFCCFGSKVLTTPLEKQEGFFETGKDKAGRVHKIIIPGRNKNVLLFQLNKIGINEMSLFPDLNGFGDFVKWKLFDYDESGFGASRR